MTALACSRCGVAKSPDEFHLDRSNVKTGRHSSCKECRSRVRRASHTRDYNLNYYYRMSMGQFAALLAAQGDGCALCGVTDPGGHQGWHVDHDHRCCSTRRTCGECVRGLLCWTCNRDMGFVESLLDRPGWLDKMTSYREGRVL